MKTTEEDFRRILGSFRNGGSEETRTKGVRITISGEMWTSPRYSEIPDYMKRSLGRKAARYIAATALKSIEKIDALAEEASFHEYYDNGKVKSFAEYSKQDGVFRDDNVVFTEAVPGESKTVLRTTPKRIEENILA